MRNTAFGLLMLAAAAMPAFSANQGRITGIHFAGANYAPHPDVVQMTVQGGFDGGTCNTELAAIRATDKHLVSLALAAYASGFTVTCN